MSPTATAPLTAAGESPPRPLPRALWLAWLGFWALMAGYFEMKQIDKNKDGMVSKKEFMDMMSKAWDAEMAAHKAKPNANMTQEEYKAFAKMFNLDIGA